jgi:hypoxanthine phosphoribosyltransferase
MNALPTAASDRCHPDIARILLSTMTIATRVGALGRMISADYEGRNPVLVGVLKGVAPFMSDLLRALTVECSMDFLSIEAYGGRRASGAVQIIKDLELPVAGRHLLMVEDIIDTGLTLHYLLRWLSAREPASIGVCTLLDRPRRRLVDLPVLYQGFEIADEFVVGYGLDYRERYRYLPYIGVLRPDVYKKAQTVGLQSQPVV